MRKEEENSEGKFPWLEDTDERKYMTDREILDKYMNLDNSCLTKTEKTQVRELLYKYKDAFSLRDEIGLCRTSKLKSMSLINHLSLLDHFMLMRKIK